MTTTKLALISDIHGNLFALEAALNDINRQKVSNIICLGDVAAFGPQSTEVLARLQELNCPIVMGNTDEWLLDPTPHPYRNEDSPKITAVETWAAEQLTEADKTFIRTFQPTIFQQLTDSISLLCFHGSPRSNTEAIHSTSTEEELAEAFAGNTATIMACGHTHTPILRRYQQSIIINPGSVGLPYEFRSNGTDIRNPAWAEYAMINIEDSQPKITFHRVSYDIHPLIEAVYQSSMPHAEWWVQDWDPD
jgi:putative phosphoesterase